MTQVQTETEVEAPPDCWPPVAHIYDKRTGPLKEGAIALCGKKLMGVDLGNMAAEKICPKCDDVFKEEMRKTVSEFKRVP